MRPALIFAILCLSWGTTWVAIRFGVTNAPPLFFAGTRFLAAGLILVGFHCASGNKLSIGLLKERYLYITSFMIIAITFGLIFWGEQYVSSGLTAVIVQGLIPVSLPLFAAMYGREKINVKAMLSISLGIFGLLIVFGPKIEHNGNNQMEIYGVLALILGTLAYCWGSVVAKFNLKAPSVIELSGYQNLIGGLALIVAGLAFEFEMIVNPAIYSNPAVILSWIHLVFVGSIIGFTMYLHVLRLWGSTKAASYAFITPIIAILIDALVLGAEFTVAERIGSIVILVAVLVTFVPLPKVRSADKV